MPRQLFTSYGKTRYPLYRRLSGPQGWSGQARKISPPTGIQSPDCPALSQLLYRLSYPALKERYAGTIIVGIAPEKWQLLERLARILQSLYWHGCELGKLGLLASRTSDFFASPPCLEWFWNALNLFSIGCWSKVTIVACSWLHS